MSAGVARWCILRTSGGQTLPLMRSLRDDGYDVWTPARTIRKILWRGRPCERRAEIDVAILPTFVFAREDDLAALAEVAGRAINPHPAFSIFRHGGRVPLVGDREIAGLREEEERAASTMRAMRKAETHEEAERIRIAAIKSEAARRRAMRAQHRTFAPGAAVTVSEMPALVGVTGVVEASDGTFAEVRFGTQAWKIEAWRLSPFDLDTELAFRGIAA